MRYDTFSTNNLVKECLCYHFPFQVFKGLKDLITYTSLICASLLLDFAISFGTAYSGITTSSVLLVTSGTAILNTNTKGKTHTY